MAKINPPSSVCELVVRTSYGADWRWQRANRLVDGQRSIRPEREDPLVASICQALRADVDPMPQALDSGWAAVFQAALEVYRLPSSRLEIEALILSGMSPGEISKRVNLDSVTVRVFQQCFFDIDWCRETPGRIVNLIERSCD